MVGAEGRAEADVVGGPALDEHVGLADGEGFGLNFLPVEVDLDLFPLFFGEVWQPFLALGEHAAGAAGRIVDEVGGGLDFVGDGPEDQPGHEANDFPRGEVFAGLLVVLLVEIGPEVGG